MNKKRIFIGYHAGDRSHTPGIVELLNARFGIVGEDGEHTFSEFFPVHELTMKLRSDLNALEPAFAAQNFTAAEGCVLQWAAATVEVSPVPQRHGLCDVEVRVDVAEIDPSGADLDCTEVKELAAALRQFRSRIEEPCRELSFVARSGELIGREPEPGEAGTVVFRYIPATAECRWPDAATKQGEVPGTGTNATTWLPVSTGAVTNAAAHARTGTRASPATTVSDARVSANIARHGICACIDRLAAGEPKEPESGGGAILYLPVPIFAEGAQKEIRTVGLSDRTSEGDSATLYVVLPHDMTDSHWMELRLKNGEFLARAKAQVCGGRAGDVQVEFPLGGLTDAHREMVCSFWGSTPIGFDHEACPLYLCLTKCE